MAAFAMTGCGGPPGDAAVSSAPRQIAASVTAAPADGRFKVEALAIQCDWYNCVIEERVTNLGSTTAIYWCSDQTAITSDGETVTDSWVGLGTSGVGCVPSDIKKGQSLHLSLIPFGVHDRKLVKLLVPGASASIPLSEVSR